MIGVALKKKMDEARVAKKKNENITKVGLMAENFNLLFDLLNILRIFRVRQRLIMLENGNVNYYGQENIIYLVNWETQ